MEWRGSEMRGCAVGGRRGSESRERDSRAVKGREGEWMHAWK